MWLLFIQITAGIIATIRGWGALPIMIFLGLLGFGFITGATFGEDFICLMSVFDWVVTIGFVIMAILGKKKPGEIQSKSDIKDYGNSRIKCPMCAELIMPDAKVCRYCGCKINGE